MQSILQCGVFIEMLVSLQVYIGVHCTAQTQFNELSSPIKILADSKCRHFENLRANLLSIFKWNQLNMKLN